MSLKYALKAELREKAGKGASRATRRSGRVPAVIYGDRKEPILISLDSTTMAREYLKGHLFTSLCDIAVNGETHLVIARDVQLHPIKDTPMHVDYMRVTPKTIIRVWVPVHFKNQEECPGIERGGVLNIVRHEVELECQATDIPDEIVVDLKGFDIGDSIHFSNAAVPGNVKPIIDDRDFTLATLTAPSALKSEEDEAAEAAAAAEGAAADAGGENKAEEEEE